MQLNHEGALQKALIAALRADEGVRAVLGTRVWDEAPQDAALPHLLVGRCESRPVRADGGGVVHQQNLTCVSDFGGMEEVKAAVAAVRGVLDGAVLSADGVRTVNLAVVFTDIYRSGDRRRVYATIRLRAVTEAA